MEREYASFVGSKYAVSCNSGTSALHLALLALGIGKGDEVIIPDFTMAAVAFAVSYTGATPVFADVDLDNYCILPSEIERLVTDKTAAVIVVDTYGRLAPMKEIMKLANDYGFYVIEDACEAQGAVYKSKADVVCYSFYKNKIISAEEGGMVTTDLREVADRCNYLKNMAFDKDHTYYHEEIGFNYRMPNTQALLALSSLNKYKENAEGRKKIEGWYNQQLGEHKTRLAVWFYDYKTNERKKEEILKKVSTARHSFKPLSSFPMYGEKEGRPNAKKLSESLVLLPVHPSMTFDDIQNISFTINKI